MARRAHGRFSHRWRRPKPPIPQRRIDRLALRRGLKRRRRLPPLFRVRERPLHQPRREAPVPRLRHRRDEPHRGVLAMVAGHHHARRLAVDVESSPPRHIGRQPTEHRLDRPPLPKAISHVVDPPDGRPIGGLRRICSVESIQSHLIERRPHRRRIRVEHQPLRRQRLGRLPVRPVDPHTPLQHARVRVHAPQLVKVLQHRGRIGATTAFGSDAYGTAPITDATYPSRSRTRPPGACRPISR